MLQLSARIRFVDQLTFSQDGRRLFASGTWYGENHLRRNNQGIDVWEIPWSSAPTSQLLPDQVANGIVVNPTRPWLYANAEQYIRSRGAIDSGYFAIDCDSGSVTRLELSGSLTRQPAMHPSGDWFIACGCIDNWSNPRIVRWRQPSSGPPEQDWVWIPDSLTVRPWSIHIDHKHSRVITVEGEYQGDQGFLGQLVFRDPSNWAVLERINLSDHGFGESLISPDGTWFVHIRGPSLFVRCTDEFHRKPTKVRGGKLHLTGIAFHPSGQYLAATSNDTTVKLYDTATWQLAKTFTWNIGRLRSIAFSPDGMLAAVGSDTGRIMVWDVDI